MFTAQAIIGDAKVLGGITLAMISAHLVEAGGWLLT
jgi:hypothetical protein